MGHVSRSIGLLKDLQKRENHIYIACSAYQKEFYKEYLPDCDYLLLEGYPFYFSGKGRFSLDLLRKYSHLKSFMDFEQKQVNHWVEELGIDIVMSDHRYGFRSRKKHSIFLTHQLNLPLNILEKPAQLLHDFYLKKFDTIWVIDDMESSLAGELSKNKKGWNSVRYIGHYSRFMNQVIPKEKEDYTVLIANGPDIYAKQLVEEYLNRNHRENLKIIAPSSVRKFFPKHDFIVVPRQQEDKMIAKAKKIISYCGYTTLMDLKFLNTESELKPTIGQREQIYLYQRHCL